MAGLGYGHIPDMFANMVLYQGVRELSRRAVLDTINDPTGGLTPPPGSHSAYGPFRRSIYDAPSRRRYRLGYHSRVGPRIVRTIQPKFWYGRRKRHRKFARAPTYSKRRRLGLGH